MNAPTTVRIMFAQRLTVKKTALACVALFRNSKGNAMQLTLVCKHVKQLVVRYSNKVLIVDPSDVYPLFPFLVISDYNIAYAFGNCIVNKHRSNLVKIIRNSVVTL